MRRANTIPYSANASTRPIPRNISVLVWSKASGWRWMEAMVCPIRYPIPAPGPMTAVPAAMPTPIMVTSPLACSNASMGGISANTSIPTPFASRLTLLTCLEFLVVAEHCQLDIDLREYSENVSLQNGHKDLEPVEHHG